MTTVPSSPAVMAERIEPYAWRVLGVSAVAVYVVFLDATIVNIAFPAISASFTEATPGGLSWVLNAYSVVFGALLVTAGGLADSRGQRRVFLGGLVVFGVASVLCAVSPSLALLVVARGVQAVGAALLVPSSLALLLPEFPVSKRAAAVGLWGAVGALAAATGPSLGALLVEGPGWRWVFYVNAPICAVAYLAGRRVLRRTEPQPAPGRPDVVGAVLVVATIGLVSLGIVQGEFWGWTSVRVLGAFVLAAALAPAVVLRGLRHPQPALPVRLFAHHGFSWATAATLVFASAFFGQILCNVLFLNGVWGWSLLHTAVAVLPAPLIAAALAPLTGRLADRVGYLPVVVPGSLVFACGTLWFALRTTAEAHYAADFLPGMVLCGIGIGAVFSNLGAAASSSLPAAQFGVGSATNAMARQLGAVLGVAVVIAILSSARTSADPVALFHDAWRTIVVFALACALAGLGLSRKK